MQFSSRDRVAPTLADPLEGDLHGPEPADIGNELRDVAAR